MVVSLNSRLESNKEEEGKALGHGDAQTPRLHLIQCLLFIVRASVGRIGGQLVGYGVSWQDRGSVGRIGRQSAGSGVSSR